MAKTKPLIVTFKLKEATGLSDRTVRRLLREYSKLVRQIQHDELDDVLIKSVPEFRVRQSLRDRVKYQSRDLPTYYVESIHTGSLIITITISTALLWALNATVTPVVQEGFKNSKFGKIPSKYVTKILDRLYRALFNSARNKYLINKLEKMVGKILNDRFVIEQVNTTESKNHVIATVVIRTSDEVEVSEIERIDNENLRIKIKQEISNKGLFDI